MLALMGCSAINGLNGLMFDLTDGGERSDAPVMCTATGVEVCNGRDDDCDGTTDGPDVIASCGSLPPLAIELTCASAECRVARCEGANGDCNGLLGDGCETPLNTVEACGACRTRCAWACRSVTCDDPIGLSSGVDFTCAVQ